jgi:uncharacterized protein YdgA (DUF945 family)
MHGPINVKSPNNTSKWQMGFNSAFKGLTNLSIYISKSKYKSNFHFRTGHVGLVAEQRCSSTVSFTSVLDEGG